MSSTSKTYLNSEYLQPLSTHSYDTSQSPLALLAQTCSSIGKDCSSSSSTITSLVTKSSSSNNNISNSDKSFSSIKNSSSLSQSNNLNPNNKKSTLSLKTKPILSSSSSFIEPNLLSNIFPPPLFDPTISLTTLFLRSSLAYLSSQQHSYSTICQIPGCLQCQTIQHILSTSINHQPYNCHWKTCNARFSSNDQLIEHIRYNHRSTKILNHQRFHPYYKPSTMINHYDQLPYFYPHLSLSSSMTDTTQCLNNNLKKQ